MEHDNAPVQAHAVRRTAATHVVLLVRCPPTPPWVRLPNMSFQLRSPGQATRSGFSPFSCTVKGHG